MPTERSFFTLCRLIFGTPSGYRIRSSTRWQLCPITSKCVLTACHENGKDNVLTCGLCLYAVRVWLLTKSKMGTAHTRDTELPAGQVFPPWSMQTCWITSSCQKYWSRKSILFDFGGVFFAYLYLLKISIRFFGRWLFVCSLRYGPCVVVLEVSLNLYTVIFPALLLTLQSVVLRFFSTAFTIISWFSGTTGLMPVSQYTKWLLAMHNVFFVFFLNNTDGIFLLLSASEHEVLLFPHRQLLGLHVDLT